MRQNVGDYIHKLERDGPRLFTDPNKNMSTCLPYGMLAAMDIFSSLAMSVLRTHVYILKDWFPRPCTRIHQEVYNYFAWKDESVVAARGNKRIKHVIVCAMEQIETRHHNYTKSIYLGLPFVTSRTLLYSTHRDAWGLMKYY